MEYTQTSPHAQTQTHTLTYICLHKCRNPQKERINEVNGLKVLCKCQLSGEKKELGIQIGYLRNYS